MRASVADKCWDTVGKPFVAAVIRQQWQAVQLQKSWQDCSGNTHTEVDTRYQLDPTDPHSVETFISSMMDHGCKDPLAMRPGDAIKVRTVRQVMH